MTQVYYVCLQNNLSVELTDGFPTDQLP